MRYIKARSSGSRKVLSSFLGGIVTTRDPSTLADGYASKCCNFEFSTGSLTDGYGLAYTYFYPNNIIKVWDFEWYNFDSEEYEIIKMCYSGNGQVYYYCDDLWYSLASALFDTAPLIVTYRLYGVDTLFMITPSLTMTWDGQSSAAIVENAPRVTTCAVHYERMFATTDGEANTLYFSDDLDPTNWNETLTEGGFIQLIDERGKLVRVLSYLNYIYIFREYGISRLTAYADQDEFTVVNLYMAGGKMYGGSITSCGDEIMLLCSDGLFRFDGYDMYTELENIAFLPSPNAVGYYNNSKYYLACKLVGDDEDTEENTSLIVYDVQTEEYAISSLRLQAISGSGDEVFGSDYDGNIGKLSACGKNFSEYLAKEWVSGTMMFGTPEEKTLREITLGSAVNIEIDIKGDDTLRSFTAVGGSSPIRIPIMMTAKKFIITIRSYGVGNNITNLTYVVA